MKHIVCAIRKGLPEKLVLKWSMTFKNSIISCSVATDLLKRKAYTLCILEALSGLKLEQGALAMRGLFKEPQKLGRSSKMRKAAQKKNGVRKSCK